ncbi:hypothetical protein [Anatilimnocola floriformis]|uniref:hypothetical protein n=1 Tax=Anatilimnocola floriformis TaxID=2948575 RepID=UPI0020C35E8F|nr:hypothetical protein [Anatilimnocola floriformis]
MAAAKRWLRKLLASSAQWHIGHDLLGDSIMKESRAPLLVAFALLLLPVLYVGSYLALVRPAGMLVVTIRVMGSSNRVATGSKTHYLLGGHAAEIIFLPLEFVDRQLRPAEWK